MLGAAAKAVEDLATLDTCARAYLAAAAADAPWASLTLTAVTVGMADTERVRKEVAPRDPDVARCLHRRRSDRFARVRD